MFLIKGVGAANIMPYQFGVLYTLHFDRMRTKSGILQTALTMSIYGSTPVRLGGILEQEQLNRHM